MNDNGIYSYRVQRVNSNFSLVKTLFPHGRDEDADIEGSPGLGASLGMPWGRLPDRPRHSLIVYEDPESVAPEKEPLLRGW